MTKFLPPDFADTGFLACVGLISDTHMPQRWATLPPAIFSLFSGANLLMHAGDVGELWVLDQLSDLAPVIAVHGNDESTAAQAHLPFQQIVTIAGQRILLWHSHHQDRATELAMRRIDTWSRILNRSAAQAKAAGAQVVVLGHLHTPFCTRHEGVWIINPGAIASGNYQTRQAIQTVALLYLREHQPPHVVHIDLAPPHAVHRPEIDWSAPFTAALQAYSANILAPGLEEPFREIGRRVFPHWPVAYHALVGPPAHRVWAGEQEQVTAADLRQSLGQVNGLPAGVRVMINDILPAGT